MSKVKKTIVIGVTSSIAAYKILDLIKLLKKSQYDVKVVMTKNAARMIAKKDFEVACSNKVYVDLFCENFDYKKVLKHKKIEYIELARKADLVLIAPATANIIGKLASGIADDFLTTFVLALSSPVLVCPAMNSNMWTSISVQKNVAKLQKFGFSVIGPDVGKLACASKGIGRLRDVAKIKKEVDLFFKTKRLLFGKKFLVTAGGTSEEIDKVRVITNKSSGKMGVKIAEKLFQLGANVILLRAKSSVTPKYSFKQEVFTNATELKTLMKKYVKKCDYVVHVAAVSDFSVLKKISGKLDSSKAISLKLQPAEKILHDIKKWNPRITLIGFKAVYQLSDREAVEKGIEKLKQSRSDYIIVNDVGRKGVGFEVDDNEVFIISKKGFVKRIEKSPKTIVAQKILETVFSKK